MIFLTGASGQLGSELLKQLEGPVFSDRIDLTDLASVEAKLRELKPKFVINCAAYTAVDKAEEEPALANALNAKLPQHLGKLSSQLGFHVVHFSTDYVFSGQALPYTETDSTDPLSAYGKSKLEGENLLLDATSTATVIRTSWLYNRNGQNFVNTILKAAKSRPELKVVFDQIGTPTFAGDLAECVANILPQLNEQAPRLLHYSNEGVASWYDFAKAIVHHADLNVTISPIRSADYPTKAHRPTCSVLDKSLIKATFGIQIPHWLESFEKAFN